MTHRDTYREEGHMMVEAEIRVMQLQAKELTPWIGSNHQRLEGRPGTDCASEQIVPTRCLDFWPPELQESKCLLFPAT